ncbi:hypothetical protein TcCL_Unassigned02895 [Trypanosoma cruzi]|nr:hypothetical protein TcCL_Unassigned02895 [Trypanosoma cruzi]
MSHRFSTLHCVYYRSIRRYTPMEVQPGGVETTVVTTAIAEVIIWRISGLALYPIGGRVSSSSVPSSTRHRKRCRVSRGKETRKKDAFTSRQETASAITGGK